VSGQRFVLCQVQTRRWTGAIQRRILRRFWAPSKARKLGHCWRHYRRKPDFLVS
jgi:hypothetical protein